MFSKIEVFLANLSFILLFLTMFYYWYQLSLGFQVESSSKNVAKSLLTVDGTVARTPSSELLPVRKITKGQLGNLTLPNIGILMAFFSLLLLLVVRWKEFGHFPLSNLYESLIFLSLSCLVLHFLTQNYFFTQENPSSVVIPNLFGSITASCTLCINAFASFSLPPEMQQGSALVPALQSNWLMMHVTVMITSYGALIVGSLFSIAYLVIDTMLKNRPETLSSRVVSSSPELSTSSEPGFFTTNLILTLDNLSYRIIGLGFPLLTIGILSGAVWANEAWGSYWSWDPKETWALLTWLVFAIYLHTRITRGWEGRKSAIMASLGFITVWVCFLGVNLLGEGLHSYGFLSK